MPATKWWLSTKTAMRGVVYVALGGALGAVCRYGISLLPYKGAFPVLTLATNLLGAMLIGFLAGLITTIRAPSDEAMLFWKTGVCGGFTTFSTFSLEAVQLFQKGKIGSGALYIAFSVIGCLLGVLAGMWLAKRVCR